LLHFFIGCTDSGTAKAIGHSFKAWENTMDVWCFFFIKKNGTSRRAACCINKRERPEATVLYRKIRNRYLVLGDAGSAAVSPTQ